MKHLLIVFTLFAGCHTESCDVPVSETDECAHACAPHKMRSFKGSQGGCAQSECVCEDAVDSGVR